MNYTIDLRYNYGFKWHQSNGVYVKGYLSDENEALYTDAELIEYYKTFKTTEEFIDKCKNANGNFVVIVAKDEKVYIAADVTRTFPIFYAVSEGRIVISDDAYYLRDVLKLEADITSTNEFLYTSYVTGSSTLLEGLKQIVAGEVLVFEDGRVERISYFNYCVNSDEILKNATVEQHNGLFRKAMQRIVDSVKGKTIVLPLSGGYDSRLIAVLLKELNYKNVICFTYGNIDNVEVQISKQVANTLGYKWLFVDYVDMPFQEDFFESEELGRYYKFANNMSSVFLLQDFFAVRHLTNNNLVPKNSVFIPGHSGDFNVGNHLYPFDKLVSSDKTCATEIFKRHYILDQSPVKKELFQKVLKSIPKEGKCYSKIENFNLKERQAKLIVNANRVYEFFGYEHRMLFWDRDLVEFFRTLKFSDKLNSKLYFHSIITELFIPNNVHIIPPDKKGNRWVRNVKQMIPYKIAVAIRKRAHSDVQLDTKARYFKVFKSIIDKYNLRSHICTGISAQWLILKEFGIRK